MIARICALLSLLVAPPLLGAALDAPVSLIVVAGAGGGPDYDKAFSEWAANWQKAGASGGARVTSIGLAVSEKDSLPRFRAAIEKEPPHGPVPLWIVLLGHGAADSQEAKFNLRGDDLSVAELSALLKRFERTVVVIHCFSASGAFLAPLAAPNRVIITATKSGSENNFSRLGKYLSETIADLSADLDHDGQTSLLEGWIAAAQRVADFYKSEGRLSTEHSLLDDNGDGKGTPSDWFSGVRVVKKAQNAASTDGLRAHQLHLVPSAAERKIPAELLARRNELETEIARLRDRKKEMPEAAYYSALEEVLLQLARLRREMQSPPSSSTSVRAKPATGE